MPHLFSGFPNVLMNFLRWGFQSCWQYINLSNTSSILRGEWTNLYNVKSNPSQSPKTEHQLAKPKDICESHQPSSLKVTSEFLTPVLYLYLNSKLWNIMSLTNTFSNKDICQGTYKNNKLCLKGNHPPTNEV